MLDDTKMIRYIHGWYLLNLEMEKKKYLFVCDVVLMFRYFFLMVFHVNN